ncbi:MvdC/MvdD family ATP grasp protein [Leptospira santarosai]|uniref:MvdC/MvdD family ATP grasp protein n=1 Tax=Leptospira santarosai TaxID=28183 RepID=UPI0024AF305C|nr:hypothetical protein [Leptospira santarosai]MDI7174870.1 hypothetical protein [Leptospira santarosai]MDI7193771.1 hypothetical protein [Leptospira santarosai]MDI7225251.1 hypothetical protein [Leptospira santarosai]MDO6395751.1 hypothetical protein [Leptospira santarosai]MDO6398922.1 hypothetical protein [Leptospira santarosai]
MNKVLIITNKEDVTVDFVVDKLITLRAEYFRLNTEDFGSALSIKIDPTKRQILIKDNYKNEITDLSSFDSVYYRRPKLPENPLNLTSGEVKFYSQEMNVVLEYISYFLENKRWLNKIENIRKTENKINQLTVAQNIGFSIPNSIITNMPAEAEIFITNNIGKSILKPLKVGFIEEKQYSSKIVYTNEVNQHFRDNINRVSLLPVYLQDKIEKKFDIRVTIVGEMIFAAQIDSQTNDVSKIDWRASKEILPHVQIQLPTLIKEYCLNLMKHFELNFSAIDLILDENNNYVFLEINPNGQWAWIEQLLNYPISLSIANYLIGK